MTKALISSGDVPDPAQALQPQMEKNEDGNAEQPASTNRCKQNLLWI